MFIHVVFCRVLIRYTEHMSDLEDRAPLLLKIALRQALRRIQDEVEALSQYEALAGNLGWQEVADQVSSAREALVEASERSADAVEAAVRVQDEISHALGHEHGHTHSHSHPHEHPHGHQHSEE
jgi:hypothetical protein